MRTCLPEPKVGREPANLAKVPPVERRGPSHVPLDRRVVSDGFEAVKKSWWFLVGFAKRSCSVSQCRSVAVPLLIDFYLMMATGDLCHSMYLRSKVLGFVNLEIGLELDLR
ncbi:hypothetical protein HYFRA_00003904 [Hymenoscyphus fraxineus]|uniref:Uncharacterized protein n=1 Tax=Hymenoscyphus fraxineus TaxID=746836 RepID=A0A9N9L3U2_9HELO|nr:hypothetical protein HYFRA_00003904 [Hymenoscyphus fraxineus]